MKWKNFEAAFAILYEIIGGIELREKAHKLKLKKS